MVNSWFAQESMETKTTWWAPCNKHCIFLHHKQTNKQNPTTGWKIIGEQVTHTISKHHLTNLITKGKFFRHLCNREFCWTLPELNDKLNITNNGTRVPPPVRYWEGHMVWVGFLSIWVGLNLIRKKQTNHNWKAFCKEIDLNS